MSFIQSLGTIFLIILTGIICRKMKILNQIHIEGFEIILFKTLTPCYLFNSIIERIIMNIAKKIGRYNYESKLTTP